MKKIKNLCLGLIISVCFGVTATTSTDIDMNKKLTVVFQNIAAYYNDTYGGFPEYYSGAYIDLETNELVICVTQTNEIIDRELKKAANGENITIEIKKYSYDELLDEVEMILAKASSLYAEYKDSDNKSLLDVFSYIGAGIDDENNCINIRIIDIDEEKIDIFKKYVSNFDHINFINSQK